MEIPRFNYDQKDHPHAPLAELLFEDVAGKLTALLVAVGLLVALGHAHHFLHARWRASGTHGRQRLWKFTGRNWRTIWID